MGMPHDLAAAAAETIEALKAAGLTVATAESCTGGLVAGALTSVPGSSAVVYGGFVTYANAAKIAMLGVDPALLAAHGAVSAQVAEAMAQGARAATGADLTVSITGVAGPDGGTPEKPVGLVHFALAGPQGGRLRERRFSGLDRDGIRAASVAEVLAMLREAVQP